MRRTPVEALLSTAALAVALAACSQPESASDDKTTGVTETVETESAATAPEPALEPIPVATADGERLGDPNAGNRFWRQCRSCHTLREGADLSGPSLYGVIGRPAGSVEGYVYSQPNKTSGVVWTEENLFQYLERPQAFIPGTIMSYAGLRDPQQRADLIAYMKANGALGDDADAEQP